MVLTSKSEEGDKLRQQSAALNELAEIEDRKEELQSDIEEIKYFYLQDFKIIKY